MKILIDADSCPVRIRELVVKAATKRKLLALFVAARQIPLPPSPFVQMLQVEAGQDMADKKIISLAQIGDLVITRDIPLAAELVEHQLRVINDRGVMYTKENVRQRLSERNFMADLRATGLESMKDGSFSQREIHAFAAVFDRELNISSRVTD